MKNDFLSLIIIATFICITIFSAIKQVFFCKEVTVNIIQGSICIYLLIGLLWAIIFLINITLVPNSFHGIDDVNWLNNFPKAIYFSFVTLTSTGYGDITPILPIVRFFSYIEAIISQFYITILVSSLVAIKVSDLSK
ncbi:ion channel (plasmid) [Vibrio sp. SS-MA-C1-2]|uniref:ion channel n=1 Tax=Vibrio sp. SS-MA-C1-2 TaxID=2908646 RepID=UPI001F3E61FF|nr:ion channel [Vibrio sp. SS-MA-C1-2]UJF20295.1 ion channel [Vibrio sp. SS-MA-C1-2]